MSIICYKDGILAADSGISANGFCSVKTLKITRSPSGWIGGWAGISSKGSLFLRWLEALDHDPSEAPDLTRSEDNNTGEALMIHPQEGIYLVAADGVLTPVHGPIAAVGIAESFALGAMLAGASAAQAVRLAIEHCDGCWGPIETLSLDPTEEF